MSRRFQHDARPRKSCNQLTRRTDIVERLIGVGSSNLAGASLAMHAGPAQDGSANPFRLDARGGPSSLRYSNWVAPVDTSTRHDAVQHDGIASQIRSSVRTAGRPAHGVGADDREPVDRDCCEDFRRSAGTEPRPKAEDGGFAESPSARHAPPPGGGHLLATFHVASASTHCRQGDGIALNYQWKEPASPGSVPPDGPIRRLETCPAPPSHLSLGLRRTLTLA